MKKVVEDIVILHLQPKFREYIENPSYWERYTMELDYLSHIFSCDRSIFKFTVQELIRSMPIGSPAHDAVVDVASTLETLAPNVYAGAFTY